MESVDPELEELSVPVAVGLSLEELDLGVRALQGAGGDRYVVVSQQTLAVKGERVGHLAELPDSGSSSPSDPALEMPPGRLLVRLFPELPEILLQVVGGREWGVQVQSLLEPLALVAVRIQLVGVLEEQPPGSLQDVSGAGRLAAAPCAGRTACRS